jgi:hypothetical protein
MRRTFVWHGGAERNQLHPRCPIGVSASRLSHLGCLHRSGTMEDHKARQESNQNETQYDR